MHTSLPQTSEAFERLSWSEIEPWYRELLATSLSEETVSSWMAQWSHLSELVDETMVRNEISTTRNTADAEGAQRKQRFLDDIYTHVQSFEQQIKQQLLDSGLEPEGFVVPLRNLRADTTIFREANVPLLNEEKHLDTEYMRIRGEQTVEWEGKEVSVDSLQPLLLEQDRELREQAWHRISERKLVDREALNALWTKGIQLRQRIGQTAGYENYRDYRWQQLHRFDYTAGDCEVFHKAVEQVIVPAASRLWEKRRQQLGVSALRPWDMQVNAGAEPHKISDVNALLQQCVGIFTLIDPQLASYFETMIQEQLFDLDDRPSKAPGGYNLPLEVRRLPFVFGRVKTMQDSVDLVFHEAGHAFQVFEMRQLPYLQQRSETSLPIEFAEVASTSMEFIGAMHLYQAGLCTEAEAAQLRIQHLENMLLHLLPMIAHGDAFQHWVYSHPEQAMNPDQCDEKWVELTRRYHPDIDWSGKDAVLRTGWQQVLHFYCLPFYYIEYALAALGAIQIWHNYLQDAPTAVQQYRNALALGATRAVPELYAAAGAKFAFDTPMLQFAVDLLLQHIEQLETNVEEAKG